MVIVCQLNACFFYKKNSIRLINRPRKWYGPETMWLEFASDDHIVVFDNFIMYLLTSAMQS